MSKERLEINHAIEIVKRETVIAKGLNDSNYNVNLPIDLAVILIEQAETAQKVTKKNIELNEFLNAYSQAEHWGQNIIDVAMDIITKQAEQIKVLERDYKEVFDLISLRGYQNRLDMLNQNKRYCEAMKKIRKLTETDAGTEEQVFIIADNILLEDD